MAGREEGRGRGRERRRWAGEEKARIVEESWKPGARVTEVARRHGVSSQQLTTWRRLAREGKLTGSSSVVALAPPGEAAFATLQCEDASDSSGSVSIEARGVTVRLDGDVAVSRIAQVALVLRSLR